MSHWWEHFDWHSLTKWVPTLGGPALFGSVVALGTRAVTQLFPDARTRTEAKTAQRGQDLARLAALEQECDTLRATLLAERERWIEERSKLEQAVVRTQRELVLEMVRNKLGGPGVVRVPLSPEPETPILGLREHPGPQTAPQTPVQGLPEPPA